MEKRTVRRGVSPPSSTLFSAPAPSQSRSRLYSHAHSQPLLHIRGRSQSRSKSPWTEESGEETEDTTSISSYQSRSRSRSASTVDYGLEHDKIREPSHRRLHLQKVFDLLHLSIARKDGVRAFRCLRILLKSHEWRPIELWRYALEVATLTSLHVNEDDNIEDSADVIPLTKREQVARKRLAFLRELSKARTGLQLDVFIEIIPELLVLGEEQQALAEIEIVINQYPYRLEPLLHLYSALLFLKLSSPSVGMEDSLHHFTLKGVSELDQKIAIVPHNLLLLREQGDRGAQSILKEAERKFETVLNVGRLLRKRGGTDVTRSSSRSRSQGGSRSRSRSMGRAQSRAKSRGRVKKEGWGDREGSDNSNEEERDGQEAQMTTDEEVDELQIEVGNDEWARNMARAYLEVLRAPFAKPARVQDSDEDMEDDDSF